MMHDIFRVYADALNVALMQPLPADPRSMGRPIPEMKRRPGALGKFAGWLVRRPTPQTQPNLCGCG
ncbi:MAG: hypothetical protein ACREE7_02530 [Dongiaceae bacterium]